MKLATKAVDIRQAFGESPQVMTDVLQDGVNLAVWRRQLPAQVEDFAALLVNLGQAVSDSRVLEVNERDAPQLQGFLPEAADLHGYEGFVADVSWLIAAFTCLLGAKRVGLRLRVLEGAMCPRFHVDHVPLRLLTTYVGAGSEWLEEGSIDRASLQQAPVDKIQRLKAGEVALLKGEKWLGNEGAGLVHRSPTTSAGERRLLLSLDWLG